MNAIGYNDIKKYYKIRKYRFFEGKLNINIFGIRSKNRQSNAFDDFVGIAFEDGNGNFICKIWEATTDPGTYFLNHPMYLRGTAIVKPGQYPGSHKIGMFHLGYEALIQCGNITYILDTNLDDILDFDSTKEETRNDVAICIHHAGNIKKSILVDKWSAGCQVFADPKDFEEFMKACNASESIYGNLFTYTLFTEEQIEEMK